jgi:predicted nucleic acid-binding protein
MSKIFFDTNILIYTLDRFDPEKRLRCREILKTTIDRHHCVISTQVMQEFYAASTQKLGVDPLIAKGILRSFENMEVVVVTPEIIYTAIDCGVLNRIAFWDALIVSTAEAANCEQLFTEDMNTGQMIRGIRIVNPL